ncbi:bifunctional adenosylcobinamide kinase/adenosylcobinamide-phosphate guanylyltransferase [Colwellia sp. UCD-KL20]|uniref:bifunctional adenosylcobinamide kinase/adenosylcobinamide-phosphate guanylyltransferase n=1 Tax=Colwellia sp. UCD-KL20 TaxID=1917165 RepID=UPI0009709EC7|nr:bifunctional adenosylcobinamide kinase/adenosylcobinamide-phosphate guanylyltransferase [Colwellia sp. UCD-KL20]
MGQVHLILGGARSGKSSLAEKCAKKLNLPVTYIATAQALDKEMQKRIALHQQDRPHQWQTLESPLLLAKAIDSLVEKTIDNTSENNSNNGQCILIDCLTLWVTNCLCHHDLAYFQQEKQQLLASLVNARKHENLHIILVSNEVGHGIVPMGDLSREFVDQAGWLHQAIAEIADKVDFVMAGLPLTLKGDK